MAFTPNDDLNIIQASDSATVSAGAGNDTYILSAATIGAGQQVTISDTQGVNTLQLVGGLTIASSSVANDAVQLTLSNGAVVTLLSASAFNFNVGGNVLSGTAGTDKDYATFAQEDLGVTVPAEGEDPVPGGEVTVEGGTTEPTEPTLTLTEGLVALQAARAEVAAQEDAIADFLVDSFANEFVEAAAVEAAGATNDVVGTLDASDVIEADIAEAHEAAANALVVTADTTASIADDAAAFNALTDTAQDARIATAQADQQAAVDAAQGEVDTAAEALESGVTALVATAATKAEALTTALDAQDAAEAAADNTATAAGAVSVASEAITYTYLNGVVTATDVTDSDAVALTEVTDGTVTLVAGVTLNETSGNYEFSTGGTSSVDVEIEQSYLDSLVSRVQAAYDAAANVVTAQTAVGSAVIAVGEAQDSGWDGSAADYASLAGNGAITVAGDNSVTLNYAAAENNVDTSKITGGADIDTYAANLATLAGAQEDQAAFDEALADWQGTEALVDQLATLNDQLTDLQDAAADALAAIENATDADPAGLGIDVLEGADNFTASDDVYLFDADAGDQALTGFGVDGTDTIFVGTDYAVAVAADGETIADNIGDVAALEVIVVDDGTHTTLYFEGETFAGNSAGVDDLSATIELTGVTGGTVAIDADGFLTIA